MATVRDIMTKDPIVLDQEASLADAARRMRDDDVGDVLVRKGAELCGIVTDRDIVTEAVAEGKDPESVTVSQICSDELVTLSPDDDVDTAVEKMRSSNIRRLPVVEGGEAVGMISLGDLAIERDPDSVLGQISAARQNN